MRFYRCGCATLAKSAVSHIHFGRMNIHIYMYIYVLLKTLALGCFSNPFLKAIRLSRSDGSAYNFIGLVWFFLFFFGSSNRHISRSLHTARVALMIYVSMCGDPPQKKTAPGYLDVCIYMYIVNVSILCGVFDSYIYIYFYVLCPRHSLYVSCALCGVPSRRRDIKNATHWWAKRDPNRNPNSFDIVKGEDLYYIYVVDVCCLWINKLSAGRR